jgi:quercetin dioxygenase-like cupin family protein
MKVIRASTRATKFASPENFTGTVFQDEVVNATAPSRVRATSVSFSPGARTAWHTHPVGQTLYVLYGTGRVQKAGEPPIVLSPGDTVIIPPDVKHWHGAAPDHLFIHLAISESGEDGAGATWLEKVSETEYHATAVRNVPTTLIQPGSEFRLDSLRFVHCKSQHRRQGRKPPMDLWTTQERALTTTPQAPH